MASSALVGDDPAMMLTEQPIPSDDTTAARPDEPRVSELRQRLAARDETIRLLNEALSAALEELALAGARAA